MSNLCRSISIVAVLLLAAGAHAAPDRAVPEREALIGDNPDAFALAGAGKSRAEAKIVPVTGQAFAKAWHVAVQDKSGGEYNVQLVAKPSAALKLGDVILFSAYARMISTDDESGEGRIGFVLEQAKDPFDKVFAASLGVGREWSRFDVPAVVDRDLAATGGQLTIRAGAHVQTLEIGGVQMRKLPTGTDVKSLPRTEVSYAGRELTAPWRKAAAERIDKLRKADFAITVVDAKGNPVPNADVHVKMTKHAFVFGSCYSPNRIVDTTDPNNETYRKTFVELFNTGVDEYAMKWPGWVNPPTKQLALDALGWMNQHGIAVRGHTLVWPGWNRLPEAVKAASSNPDALQSMIRQHISAEVTELKGKVIDWDVVNEAFVNNDLMKVLGDDALVDWYEAAREADPQAKLYLNETSVPTSPPNDERYTALYDRAKRLKDMGAPIDGVGMQSHFGENVQPPTVLLSIYDRFAKLGLPVRITELDIDSNDENLQADYYRDFLTASFSHPNINGIMIWGFWEGSHWRPNAAMFRKDWSPRPTAAVWKDLIFKQWWTDEHVTTSGQGAAKLRGFLGDYEIDAAVGSRHTHAKSKLSASGATVRLVLED